MSQITSRIPRQAQSMVALLSKHGVRPGDLVAVTSHSSLIISRLLYTARHLGVAVFPIDPLMGRERRSQLLAQSGCNMVLTDVELGGLPDEARNSSAHIFTDADKVGRPNGRESDVQLIVATSGSEGDPKGVMLSWENIAASVAASRNRMGLKGKDIWLNCLPMFHIGGIMILYRCLDAGAGMLLHNGFDADRVWADLNDYQVTHVSLVPAMLARLLDTSGDTPPPESLRVALIGGTHLSPDLAARAHAAGWPLCVSYGMSETCSHCVTDCGEQAGLIQGQVGLPLDGFEIAFSEQGRIKVRGPAVMSGYLNPGRSPGHEFSEGGWFETGDLGEMDGLGQLLVLGRADDMMISGGNNIHPREVEELLIDCPGINEVAVGARPDHAWGDLMVAVYTGCASVEELESWCRTNLASAVRPREVIRVSELPRNEMGKLDRNRLKAMVNQS